MRRISERAVFYLALTTIFMLTVSATAHAQGGVTKTGTLADGATYLIEVPANWNGTLFLYSHGYVPPDGRFMKQYRIRSRFSTCLS